MSTAAPLPSWAGLDTSSLGKGFEDYDIDSRTPDAPGQLASFQQRSEAVQGQQGIQQTTVSYGDHLLAAADVFRPTSGAVRGTIVFVHGGYWKGKGRPNRAFLAPAWVNEGVQWINLGYPVVPETPMHEISRHIGGALRAIVSGAAPFDMVEGPIVLSGNSAGAHLVAQALVQGLPESAPGRIAGYMLLSGLYDLRPVAATPAQEWLRLDDEQAFRLSPLCQKAPQLRAPVMVAVGAEEPDAFIAQSRAYAQHLLGHAQVDYQEGEGLNHLSMIASLDGPQARFGRPMAAWLGLPGHANA